MTNEKPKQKLSSKDNEKQKLDKAPAKNTAKTPEKEIGGYEDAGLPEPTRYNDWEVKGRCSDF